MAECARACEHKQKQKPKKALHETQSQSLSNSLPGMHSQASIPNVFVQSASRLSHANATPTHRQSATSYLAALATRLHAPRLRRQNGSTHNALTRGATNIERTHALLLSTRACFRPPSPPPADHIAFPRAPVRIQDTIAPSCHTTPEKH
jgi:hypothetical protein